MTSAAAMSINKITSTLDVSCEDGSSSTIPITCDDETDEISKESSGVTQKSDKAQRTESETANSSTSGSMKKSAGTCFSRNNSNMRGKLGIARKSSMSSSDSSGRSDNGDSVSQTSQGSSQVHRGANKESPDSDDESRPEVADVRDILNALEEVEMIDRETFENFRRQLRELDLLENDLFDLEESVPQAPEVPSYPMGESQYMECGVCLVEQELHLRPCCQQPICQDCMNQYLSTQVLQANIRIQCPSFSCDTSVHRDEILASLQGDVKDKFYRFLVEANKEPHVKTCPRCSYIHAVEKHLVAHPGRRKHGLKVECPECELEWCFLCQAPWHHAMKCSDFQRGDKLLRSWAKEQHYGQANAQRCPRCNVFIQRSSGCDHMTCTKCKAEFCYRCGERFVELKFIGDHYSKLSIFGCKYRFKPDQPVQRRFIRGAVFGGKLVAAPIIAGLAIGAGAVVLSIGVIALPFYGSYKLHQHMKQRKRAKKHRKMVAEWRQKLTDMRNMGDPYLERWRHLQGLGADMANFYPQWISTPPDGDSGEISGRVTEADVVVEMDPSLSLHMSSSDSESSLDSEDDEETFRNYHGNLDGYAKRDCQGKDRDKCAKSSDCWKCDSKTNCDYYVNRDSDLSDGKSIESGSSLLATNCNRVMRFKHNDTDTLQIRVETLGDLASDREVDASPIHKIAGAAQDDEEDSLCGKMVHISQKTGKKQDHEGNGAKETEVGDEANIKQEFEDDNTMISVYL